MRFLLILLLIIGLSIFISPFILRVQLMFFPVPSPTVHILEPGSNPEFK